VTWITHTPLPYKNGSHWAKAWFSSAGLGPGGKAASRQEEEEELGTSGWTPPDTVAGKYTRSHRVRLYAQ
jgi:hypothetical protein